MARKTKEATLVANVMRAMQDEEYQELHEVIEYITSGRRSLCPRWNANRN